MKVANTQLIRVDTLHTRIKNIYKYRQIEHLTYSANWSPSARLGRESEKNLRHPRSANRMIPSNLDIPAGPSGWTEHDGPIGAWTGRLRRSKWQSALARLAQASGLIAQVDAQGAHGKRLLRMEALDWVLLVKKRYLRNSATLFDEIGHNLRVVLSFSFSFLSFILKLEPVILAATRLFSGPQ